MKEACRTDTERRILLGMLGMDLIIWVIILIFARPLALPISAIIIFVIAYFGGKGS